MSVQIVSLVLITYQLKIANWYWNGQNVAKNIKKHFNKDLIKRFENTYQFCVRDINKFILWLRKGVYPYEYMDSLKRFDEELFPEKEVFFSFLKMEDITNVDYRHAKRVYKKLIIKI